MKEIVQVENLTKKYKDITAVDNLSFKVHQGEIFGILGPNGAGKTTTIECIEGLRKPEEGSLKVLDMEPRTDRKKLRKLIGMQLQQSNLPDRIKVWEALDLYASFYPNTTDWKILLKELGLEEKRNTAFAKLSGGQKQRLFIALALLPNPQLIFLDELTTGLDPQARHTIWDLIREVRSRGTTVVLTTHFMEEAEELCDRLAIMDHGKIVAMDTPSALISSLGEEDRVSFAVDDKLPDEFEKKLGEGITIEYRGERVVIHGKTNGKTQLVSQVVTLLGSFGIAFRDLRTEQPNLEDVFLSLTGRKIRE